MKRAGRPCRALTLLQDFFSKTKSEHIIASFVEKSSVYIDRWPAFPPSLLLLLDLLVQIPSLLRPPKSTPLHLTAEL